MVEQKFHIGVETAAVFELNGQTFGERDGKNAGRFKSLEPGQNLFYFAFFNLQLFGYGGAVAAKISGRVKKFGQAGRNNPFPGCGKGEQNLFVKIAVEGFFRRETLFKIVKVIISSRFARRQIIPPVSVLSDFVSFTVAAEIIVEAVVIVNIGRFILRVRCFLWRIVVVYGLFMRLAVVEALVFSFKKRIGFQFFGDQFTQFQIGHLQQINGLPQLRSHQ